MVDQVIHGDCLEVMRGMPDCSVDACVVDPPYGFGEVKDIAGLLQAWMQDEDDIRYLGKGGFMGKEWDSGVPGPRYWREVYRVLKPGAHILAFSSTLCAAIQEGFHFIGIDESEEYCRIAEARIHHAMQEVAKRAESDGQEWECVDLCPIKVMNQQTGIRKSGGRTKHRGDVTKNTHIYHPHTAASEFEMDRSQGYASRYFTQLPPDPVSLWDLLAEDE